MPPTEARPDRLCRVYNVSGALIRFEQTWIWQQRLFRERLDWQRQKPRVPGHDVLLMVEHNDIYTLGRRSSLDHLKFDPFSGYCEHEVRRTERGGEVTWHGPGQLVAYPIMDLNYHKKDLHWYLRQLEEVRRGLYLKTLLLSQHRRQTSNLICTRENGRGRSTSKRTDFRLRTATL